MGAVDGHPGKAQGLRTAESGEQESVQPQPHLSLDPLGQAAPAGHAETEPMRHLFSANPGAQDEQDALEHKPVRMPLAPGVPRPALNPGHQRPQRHPPLFIDIPQLRPSHPAPPKRQARSDPITSKIISSGVLEQSENLIQDPGNMSQFAQAVVHPNSSSSPVLTLESGAPSTQAKPAIPGTGGQRRAPSSGRVGSENQSPDVSGTGHPEAERDTTSTTRQSCARRGRATAGSRRCRRGVSYFLTNSGFLDFSGPRRAVQGPAAAVGVMLLSPARSVARRLRGSRSGHVAGPSQLPRGGPRPEGGTWAIWAWWPPS